MTTTRSQKLPGFVVGTNEFGTRIDAKEADKIIEKFVNCIGEGTAYIDTAILYGGGKSELLLSRYSNHPNILISTKVSPYKFSGLDEKSIELQCNISLQRFKFSDASKPKLDILYLHQGTKATPILETLFAINKLYKQGKFKRFGICHYSAWELTEIVFLCSKYELIKPSVYQGRYNVLRREIENELIPCLRHFNIAFYAFSPTARGILTDGELIENINGSEKRKRHQFEDVANNNVKTGKFTSEWKPIHFNDYWYKSFFEGRDIIDKAIENENISFLEANFSWILYHSILDGNKGDRIIIGGSKFKHFQQNLNAIKNAKPLNDKIVNAFNMAWKCAKQEYLSYHSNKEKILKLFMLQKKTQPKL